MVKERAGQWGVVKERAGQRSVVEQIVKTLDSEEVTHILGIKKA